METELGEFLLAANRFRTPIVIPNDSRVTLCYFEPDSPTSGKFDEPSVRDLIDFGIPKSDARVRIRWDGGFFDQSMSGYTLELFGVEPSIDMAEHSELTDNHGVTTPHFVRYAAPRERGGFCAWACRVYGPDWSVIVEEVWNPRAGWLRTLSRARLVDMRKATGLIARIEYRPPSLALTPAERQKPGAPKGKRAYTESKKKSCERRLTNAANTLRMMKPPKPRTREKMSEEAHIDIKTLDRWLFELRRPGDKKKRPLNSF